MKPPMNSSPSTSGFAEFVSGSNSQVKSTFSSASSNCMLKAQSTICVRHEKPSGSKPERTGRTTGERSDSNQNSWPVVPVCVSYCSQMLSFGRHTEVRWPATQVPIVPVCQIPRLLPVAVTKPQPPPRPQFWFSAPLKLASSGVCSTPSQLRSSPQLVI
ncbi:MAG: hypothetical protein HC882_01330 [Acidobacteria bacterium]|nr:hypothetical protein [Acidobacteriota bacterium]